MLDLEVVHRLGAETAASEDEVACAHRLRDFELVEDRVLEGMRGVKRPPIATLSKAELVTLVSPEAILKVIEFEVTSEAAYHKRYEFPIKPGADSGITIGIGYDLGFNPPEAVKRDLAGLLPEDQIAALSAVCGLTKDAADQARASVGSIRLPWEKALQLFETATVPRFAQMVRETFANADELKGHAFGALFSLVYNRGNKLTGDRRREMAKIAELMAERRFAEIPEQFEDMKRIWINDPKCSGVVKRRHAEAILFQRGLDLRTAAPIVVAAASTLERYAPSDLAKRDGDGATYEELPEDGVLHERAHGEWEKVAWASDERSPDYSHIPDRALSGTTFGFGPNDFELLIAANSFAPVRENGRIIFALRGAQLVTALTDPTPMERQENRAALILCEVRPNHRELRCVIGVYDSVRGRLSGYTGSTVPNPKAVASYVGGGDPSNMMLTGCYKFDVGWHQESRSDRKIPGCLIENSRQRAVLRTRQDYTFDIGDAIDDASPCGDNLHPGKSEGPFPFSSWGCLVVKGSVDPLRDGDRASAGHTGEWARFRRSLGLAEVGTGDHGRTFDVVLLTGLEAAIACDVGARKLDPAGEVASRQLYRLRQGSTGPRVQQLRQVLGLAEGTVFDHRVAQKLAAHVRRADGIYSPADDARLAWAILAPTVVVAQAGGLERTGGKRDVTSDRNAIAYELGLLEAARRHGNGPEGKAYQESLRSAIVDVGSAALLASGNFLLREAETMLRSYICQRDGLGRILDRDALRQRVDEAAKSNIGVLRHVLVVILKSASFSFVPDDTLGRIVDFMLSDFVAPHLGSAGTAVVARIDGGVSALCSHWDNRIATLYGASGKSASDDAPSAEPSLSDAAAPGTTVTLLPTPRDDRAATLLASIATAAEGDRPDTAAIRSLIRDLRDILRDGKVVLTPSQAQAFFDILCDTRFMEQIAGAVGRDPYEIMTSIETAIAARPLDTTLVEQRVRALCELLGDARIELQPKRIETTLRALRTVRMPGLVTLLADRLLTRNPDAVLLGVVAPHYALGLIDSHQIVAGIELLEGTLQNAKLTQTALAEVYGNLGRAHKQIYVNHVKTPSDAVALEKCLGDHLVKAIGYYGRIWDSARPGENYWHGINLVALLRRAREDRITVSSPQTPAALAAALIAALTQGTADDDDSYRLATLGEAYLAVGDLERSALNYAAFAAHPGVGAFALNSAVRQLEEVWRLQAGKQGASGILTGLKAALGQKEGGRIVLSSGERAAIANANVADHQEHFESRTQTGKLVPMAYLQRIVFSGMAVAAIKQRANPSARPGSGETVGTGFLIDGAAFGYSDDRSYLLTNAHVIWDPARGPGQEDNALSPAAVEIMFDGGGGANEVYADPVVLWQSQSCLHDATLVALPRKVTGIKPLTISLNADKLIADDGSGKVGTRLAVVGHPEGGALSIGLSGSIEEISARLVDKGCRGNSTDPEYLHYTAPTEPGNSGSPIFEAQGWGVIGLHHAGFNQVKGRPRLGGKAGSQMANEGIWIESIRSAVLAQRQAEATVRAAAEAEAAAATARPRRGRWFQPKDAQDGNLHPQTDRNVVAAIDSIPKGAG